MIYEFSKAIHADSFYCKLRRLLHYLSTKRGFAWTTETMTDFINANKVLTDPEFVKDFRDNLHQKLMAHDLDIRTAQKLESKYKFFFARFLKT